jgi:hypothetical protein
MQTGRVVRIASLTLGVCVYLAVASGSGKAEPSSLPNLLDPVAAHQQPSSAPAAPRSTAAPATAALQQRALLDQYCIGCHNERLKTGGLALDALDLTKVGDHAEVWEKVVRKLRGGLMPPPSRPRPEPSAQDGFVISVENAIDRAAALTPNPGRTETFHRLNRAEYQNAVKDVLGIDVDVASLLPGDSASYGFDNMAGALKISESLMERYLSAARKISRAAVGATPSPVAAQIYLVSPALLQNEHVEGLPFGTRGGTLLKHQFTQDAEYAFRLEVAGAAAGAGIDVLLDGERLQLMNLKPGGRAVDVDGNELAEKLEFRTRVKAGPHNVGVAFLYTPPVLSEANRKPFGNPTVSGPGIPVLRGVTITGPFEAAGAGETPSRQRIFVCSGTEVRGQRLEVRDQGSGNRDQGAEQRCARQILSNLARRAFRRPVVDEDLKILLTAYEAGRTGGDFEAGIERGIQQLLVSPEFLFRVEADPADSKSASNYRVSDLELASRLSFFIWSTVPDEPLITLATQGRLKNPAVFDREVQRMLADPKSTALTSNFVGQWLQLRNLQAVTPSEVLFPNFNDSLRHDLRRETELFFESILREDRSALELVSANYTFLNDRLARHYDIPNINGTHFRRVTLTDDRRRGILGQGSILTITSQPVRTSPVFRGKWILETLLGTPPPPPPPNVPPLPEKKGVYAGAGKMPSMRERMAEHRSNPTCASCHAMIDPLGFGLEHFDPVGRWRDVDELYAPIDASGVLPDGSAFDGVAQLRSALLKHPDRFVTALTEKLLTYSLGRGLEYYDMPAVRKIVRDAARSNYKLSAVIQGITKSLPFQMRRTAPATQTAN